MSLKSAIRRAEKHMAQAHGLDIENMSYAQITEEHRAEHAEFAILPVRHLTLIPFTHKVKDA